MIVTDYFLSLEELNSVGADIRAGRTIEYPHEAIDEYIKLFEEQDAKNLPEAAKYIVGAILIAAVIGFICFIWFGI